MGSLVSRHIPDVHCVDSCVFIYHGVDGKLERRGKYYNEQCSSVYISVFY